MESSRSRDLVAEASDARDRGDLLLALELLRHAEKADPTAARPPFEAARVLRRLGLSGAAQHSLDRALSRNPGLRGRELVAGLIAADRGQHQRALDCFSSVTHASPDSPYAHALVARELRMLGRWREALDLTTRTLDRLHGHENVAHLLEEHVRALAAGGELQPLREALPNILPRTQSGQTVWDAAMPFVWQRRFEEALQLVDALEPVVREHAPSVARYRLRRRRIQAARHTLSALDRAQSNRPQSRLIPLTPHCFADAEELDALDVERVDGPDPRQYYLVDRPNTQVPRRSLGVDLWSDPTLARKLACRPQPVSFQYLLPNCFVHCDRSYSDSDRHAIVTRDGRFAPDLLPERCLCHWTRTAFWDPAPSAPTLPLAFVLPTIGWNSYFHSVVDALATLIIYRRLNLTCPIVTPGPVGEIHRRIIEASGVGSDVEILSAQEVRGREIELALCPAPGRAQGDGSVTSEALREWCRVVTENLAPVEPAPAAHLLYISRSRADRRPLLNESELEASLARRRGARVVHMEEMALEAQVAAVRAADVIVAPHGAGLTNLIFARPGTIVIELFPDRYIVPHYAWLADRLGLTYVALAGRVEGDATSQRELAWRVEIERVHDLIERTEAPTQVVAAGAVKAEDS